MLLDFQHRAGILAAGVEGVNGLVFGRGTEVGT
jgi:hypothetical protein